MTLYKNVNYCIVSARKDDPGTTCVVKVFD